MKKTLRIAVCEDTQSELDSLLAILDASKIPLTYTVFRTGEELLQIYQVNSFDLIFMDIYMGGLTGIETVAELRKIDEAVNIAFTTTCLDFTLESYRLDALKYIEKPVRPRAINELLQLVQLKVENVPKLTVTIKGHEVQIPLTEILCIEQKGNYFFIHRLGDEPIKVAGKIPPLLDQLDPDAFYQCHKSYIVHFAFVKALNKEFLMFEMMEGDNVHIKRDGFWKTKKAYEDYLFTKARRIPHE